MQPLITPEDARLGHLRHIAAIRKDIRSCLRHKPFHPLLRLSHVHRLLSMRYMLKALRILLENDHASL